MLLSLLQENPSDTVIPAYPMLTGSGSITDLSAESGAVGIMFNGVSLYRFANLPTARYFAVLYAEQNVRS